MLFQTRCRVLNLSEKLSINQGFIIQKIPMLFWVILQCRVQDKGDLYSRWSLVRMLHNARMSGKEHSDIL